MNLIMWFIKYKVTLLSGGGEILFKNVKLSRIPTIDELICIDNKTYYLVLDVIHRNNGQTMLIVEEYYDIDI